MVLARHIEGVALWVESYDQSTYYMTSHPIISPASHRGLTLFSSDERGDCKSTAHRQVVIAVLEPKLKEEMQMLVLDEVITKPKLLIVDPKKSMLTTLASALHSRNYGIVGTATEPTAAIEYFGRVKPDVLVTEIDLNNGLSGTTGVDLAVHLRSLFPMLGIVFCTSVNDKNFVSAPPRIIESSYFLPKHRITKMDIIELAIKESVRLIRSPETPSHDIFQINSESQESCGLTKADVQLLALIAGGLSNKKIALKKGIALKSCENAIARLAKKLEIPFLPETNQRVMLVRAYFKYMGKIA